MPQDKRLIVTKAVLHKLQRVCHGNASDATSEGIFIEFVLPSVVLAQCPELQEGHLFFLPQRVYPRDGRSTCLIVPKAISLDCFKINKRHGYYDAVVTAEAICRPGDSESLQRASRVANTFSHFIVDARIRSKLPACILTSVTSSGSTANRTPSAHTAKGGRSGSETDGKCPRKCITSLEGLDERQSLSFRLSQGCTGGKLRSTQQGQLIFRVGHGGMTAGDICENAKCFVFALKKDFPTVWKYIHELKLTSNKTDSIRFMEVQIQR